MILTQQDTTILLKKCTNYYFKNKRQRKLSLAHSNPSNLSASSVLPKDCIAGHLTSFAEGCRSHTGSTHSFQPSLRRTRSKPSISLLSSMPSISSQADRITETLNRLSCLSPARTATATNPSEVMYLRRVVSARRLSFENKKPLWVTSG